MDGVLSTGEIARICRVSQNTVIRWVDIGLLKGYQIPGSRFRRVPRAELDRFVAAHGVPADMGAVAAPSIRIPREPRRPGPKPGSRPPYERRRIYVVIDVVTFAFIGAFSSRELAVGCVAELAEDRVCRVVVSVLDDLGPRRMGAA